MDRLTRDMATAERVIKNASTTVDELEATLQAALAVAGNCHQRYAQAHPTSGDSSTRASSPSCSSPGTARSNGQS